jgi:hypothetical protein
MPQDEQDAITARPRPLLVGGRCSTYRRATPGKPSGRARRKPARSPLSGACGGIAPGRYPRPPSNSSYLPPLRLSRDASRRFARGPPGLFRRASGLVGFRPPPSLSVEAVDVYAAPCAAPTGFMAAVAAVGGLVLLLGHRAQEAPDFHGLHPMHVSHFILRSPAASPACGTRGFTFTQSRHRVNTL